MAALCSLICICARVRGAADKHKGQRSMNVKTAALLLFSISSWRLESVRNRDVSELLSVRVEKWKVSGSENIIIGKCLNRKVSEFDSDTISSPFLLDRTCKR